MDLSATFRQSLRLSMQGVQPLSVMPAPLPESVLSKSYTVNIALCHHLS